MLHNMGGFDRVTRAGFAGMIFLAGLMTGHWELCIPSGIAILTGSLGYCPFYTLFGYDSLDDAQHAEATPERRAA